MTEKANEIKSKLMSKFGLADTAIRIPRALRIFVDGVDQKTIRNMLEFAKKELNFSFVTAMTGTDEGETFGIIHHMAQLHSGILLNIKTLIPKTNPVTETITDLFPGTDIFEREIFDLFGIRFKGLPDGNRYPLTDDWPKDQFPLRKDWKSLDGQIEGEGKCQA
jgi:NADH:ubiquinone oxidoreductase subunit C